MKERKIVQIGFDAKGLMFAVSDDGIIWLWSDETMGWYRSDYPSLPPREDESEPGISLEPTRRVFPTTVVRAEKEEG